MKISRFKLILLTLGAIMLTIGIISNIPDSSAAFGSSPPWVKNDHMLPGTSYEQIINFSRSSAETEVKAIVKLSGDERLLKMIEIEDMKKLGMKKGQTTMPMKVTVEVPKRAELKRYVGSIFVSLTTVKEDESLGGGEVGISLGANIKVDITVIGDKVFDYRIKSVSVDSIPEGEPFAVNVELENLGNVAVGNVNGQIDIYDSAQKDILKSLDFIPLSEPVSASEVGTSTMVYEDTVLPPGQYWVFVKTFLDGKVEYENRLPLEVKAKVVPVVTPEDAESSKPAVPKITEEADEPIEIDITEAQEATLRPAAADSGASNFFLIFGLAGLGFGLIALLGVIVVLVIVLKNQQRPTMIASYPMPMPFPQPQPPVAQPPVAQPPVAQPPVAPPTQSPNIQIHAEDQK